MNPRTLAALALFSTLTLVRPAAAEEPSTLARDAVSFVFDFCGAVLGTHADPLEAARKTLDTATMFPAEPVSPQSTQVRDAVVSVLGVANDTPVLRVTFKKSTPKILALGYVRTDLERCMVGVIGHSDAMDDVLANVSRIDSGWQELYGAPDSRNWQRTRKDGRVLTMTVMSSDSAVTMTMESGLPLLPSVSEFDEFADTVRDTCVRSVLDQSKPDATRLEKLFKPPQPNNNGSVLLESRKDIPGGRLVLLPQSAGWGCLLAIDKADAKVPYQTAFAASFMRLPGATHIETPSESWLVKDAATTREAGMGMNTDSGMLVIGIIPAPSGSDDPPR